MFSFISEFFKSWTSAPATAPNTTSKTIYGFKPEEIEEMRMDVVNALYKYFDDFDNNRIPNPIVDPRDFDDEDDDLDYNSTIYSLEPQINKKYY